MGTSVRKLYDAELMQLDTMLARMGHAAGGAIESAMTALRTGDVELARSVIARDSEIDSAEHEIEHRCLPAPAACGRRFAQGVHRAEDGHRH